ncbi:MAG: hypothetical protein WCJ71_03745, partial [Candidatus Omnitrophota bacterium]
KIIAGMMKPSRGTVEITWRATGLLDLGAGLQPELTGHDNIYFNANLFGLTQKQIDDIYGDIEAFASLGKFIYAPVQCYSQGMFVRLSFSIAIHMNPDVLVIDDTLSVGDEHFQKKCLKKIFELKESGKTIVFATHDMSLLKKLSQRVILLKEGGVVSDGPMNKVLPLYAQMVGAKQGVADLEKGGLRIVFNNGKLFLNWNGHLFTPQAGICVSILINGAGCNASEAEWQVEKKDGGFVAKGSFHRFDISQIWKIELTVEGKIVFNVHFEGREAINIQERCISVMLSHEYKYWLTLTGEGVFPPIDEKQTAWSDVLGVDSPPNCVGLEGQKDTSHSAPSLIIKQVNPTLASRLRLITTDHFTNARVLEYREKKEPGNISAQDYSSLGFSGEIIVGNENMQSYFQGAKSDYCLTDSNLELIFEKGKCSVFFGEKKLTKARHLTTAFYMNNRWHSSELASWECRKENANKFIAKGIWPGLGIIQAWTVELLGNNSFSWLVEMEVDREVEIPEQHLYLMFSEEYDVFQSDYGHGRFPEGFLENEIDVLQKSIPGGTISLMGSSHTIPSFSLVVSKTNGTFMKIFNSDLSYRARNLRVGRVEPESGNKFFKGRHFCFEVTGKVGDTNNPLIVTEEKTLKKGNISFAFHKGSGKIFWGNKELTKRLGIYTSLNFQGRWHNSSTHAVWTTGEDKKGMLFVGKWLKVPLIQTWQFQFGESDSINWKMELNVQEPIKLEHIQVNIMLSELYGKWMGRDSGGELPPFKNDGGDEWPSVWSSGQISSERINFAKIFGGQEGFSLPAIKFLLSEKGDLKHSLNILNSDICHRGRILQCMVEADGGVFLPGKYSVCNSTITLEKA